MPQQPFNLAICQMKVSTDKQLNIEKAVRMIGEAAQQGAQMVALPEMFNCPYDNLCFPVYAEEESGETVKRLSEAAGKYHLHIVAGSIPERCGKKLYNTSYVMNDRGILIGKYRKMHLFDLDIEGEIAFKESDTLSAGDTITVIETPYCKIGIAICYDIRFPEMLRIMALKGAEVVILPAAFNMSTGPAHWELLLRARAVDNQLYIAAISPARDDKASYVAYGHSMLVDPWGNILKRAGEREELILHRIDLDYIRKIRQQLPTLRHRRTDIYNLSEKHREKK